MYFAVMFCWVYVRVCDVYVLCSDSDRAGVDYCDKACSVVELIHVGRIESHDTRCVHIVH